MKSSSWLFKGEVEICCVSGTMGTMFGGGWVQDVHQLLHGAVQQQR